MSEVPTGWTELRLGEIAARTSNVDPSKSPAEIFELYSVPSFSQQQPEVAQGTEIKSAKQSVQPCDVLLCKIVPHINRVWVVGDRTDKRQIASGEWIVFRDHGCDPHYLRYCLTERSFRGKFMQTVSGVGGSLMRARPSQVAEIEVPLAPLPEQRRIVAKIDSLIGKSKRARDHLDHIPRLVEKYKQAVLAAAFRGDLTREWRTQNGISATASDFVDARQLHAREMARSTGKGRDEKTAQFFPDADMSKEIAAVSAECALPQGWCWTSIGSVFGVYIGATPSRKEPSFWNGNIPWVSSGEVAFCRIAATREMVSGKGLASTSTRLHPPGTVLIGMIGEGKTRGQAAILDLVACNNQNCAAIRVSEAEYSAEYVYWYLWSVYENTRNVGAGNNQPALNKDRVQRLLLPLAPAAEAIEIAKLLETAFARIDRLASQANSARRLIEHLSQEVLAKAFRGDLVPQDPTDEPANLLLERLRIGRTAAPKAKRGRRKAA